jgi:hypothetical protein
MFDPRRAWWCAPLIVIAACGGGSEEVEESPIDQLMGGPSTPAEYRATGLQIEELVATCMGDAGFEYTPFDAYADAATNGPDDDPSNPDYGEKYGYGIVHGYATYELPFLDSDGSFSDTGEQDRNPNDAYVMTLSPSESERYYHALEGDQMVDESSAGPQTPEERGCRRNAELEVYGDIPLLNEALGMRYYELDELINDDPEVVDAQAAWARCLYEIDPDYDFVGLGDPLAYVDRLLNEAKGLERRPYDDATGFVVGDETGSETINAVTEGDDGQMWAYVGTPKRLTQQQVDATLAAELELWKADKACQDESGLKDIRRQREQELADTLLEEFPQYAPASGEAAD